MVLIVRTNCVEKSVTNEHNVHIACTYRSLHASFISAQSEMCGQASLSSQQLLCFFPDLHHNTDDFLPSFSLITSGLATI